MSVESPVRWPEAPGPEWSKEARLDAKRALAEPPLLAVSCTWLQWRLARETDAEGIATLWQKFWKTRADAAIRAFDGGGDFLAHVQRWSEAVEDRILCLSAKQWTALEREFVLRWLFNHVNLRWQFLTALRNGIAFEKQEDAVYGFWETQGFDPGKGVLTTYKHESSTGCVPHFRGFVRVALKRYCWRLAGHEFDEQNPLDPLDDGNGPQDD
jgi:hypothetical protein